MATLGTDVKGIGEYLSIRSLAIPDYQRSYSWGPEGDRNEVQELWDDLSRAIREDQPEYFLGAIVTIRDGNSHRSEVIDGQQRLATVSLMFAAMRDLLADSQGERAKEIETGFLGRKDFRTRELTQYLTLNAEDNDVFRQITLVPEAARVFPKALASHKRLHEAYQLFKDRFTEITAEGHGTDWAQPLVAWHEYVEKRAIILEIAVQNESRGFVIFETLNDRGLNLSTADLLKNHLFGKADERLSEVKSRWGRVVAPFEEPDGRLDIDTFLRHYWGSRMGIVRVKGLFMQIKPTVNDAADALTLADNLQRASTYWTAMFDSRSDVWSGYSKGAVAALETLQSLSVEQCRPLLLAALVNFQRVEVERLLTLVVNWSVRWLVAGGGGAGTTERLYAATAKEITSGTIRDAGAVAARFDASVPSDLAFEEAFKDFRVRRGWLARYLLSALEREEMGSAEPELVPNEDVAQVNLEHVLPKSPDPSWHMDFTPEEAAELVWWLGNQCLLARTPNSSLGNKPFTTKAPVLAASAFRLTSEIGSRPTWDPAAIRSRQIRLATVAMKVWRRG